MVTERKHKSKGKNNGNFNGLYILISAVLILAVILFGSIVFFKINRIEVQGNVHYTEEQVVEASGVQIGDNLMLTRSTSVIVRLQKELPYIDSVSIYRKLPDTLTIAVSEANAKAAIYDGRGNWWLMDTSGKLLEEIPGPEGAVQQEEMEPSGEGDTAEGSVSGVAPEPESVPMPDPPEGYLFITGLTLFNPSDSSMIQVDGEGPRSQTLMRDSLLNLLPALESHELLADVTSIDLSGESEILVHYQNRLTIKLLQDMDYDYQAKLIRGVLDTYVASIWAEEDTGTLDMTFADGNPRLTKGATE